MAKKKVPPAFLAKKIAAKKGKGGDMPMTKKKGC